jgi:hypothetical protein
MEKVLTNILKFFVIIIKKILTIDLEECDTLNCNSHGICLKYNSENICCCDVGFKVTF